jgi:hypothetical protein
LPQLEVNQSAKLKIGAVCVTPADRELVRAYVQLSNRIDQNFPWIYSEDAPFDAVFVDATNQAFSDVDVTKLARDVIFVTNEADVDVPDMISRPLRFGRFEYLLEQKAHDFRGDERGRIGRADPNRELPPPPDKYQYKLLRWPSPEVLKKDPFLVRVSAILSKGQFDLNDLSRITRTSVEKCYFCIQMLEGFGMLEKHEKPAALSLGQQTRQLQTQPKEPGVLSFVERIRKRLGI